MTVRLPSYSKMPLPNLRKLATSQEFTLTSGSPRRHAILTEAGIPFRVIVPGIKEKFAADLDHHDQAMSLAKQKVLSVAGDDHAVCLGCDTIVVYGDTLLAKPEDEADARRILTFLSGKTHSVITGLALRDCEDNTIYTGFEESRVTFNVLEANRIDDYIASGEPMDKAGAYGIQGMGRFLVDSVEGNIDNVVGLPMNELERLAGLLLSHHA